MFRNDRQIRKTEFKEINFNHLMSIYELNYHNFKQAINSKFSKNHYGKNIKNLIIEDIFHDKFTRIFKMYHKFSYDDQVYYNQTFSIKPHLIFYMYEDAQLLEVKSLRDNQNFKSDIDSKIKLNLNLFYWLKRYINQ
jgi:uncharacterized protein YqiB (DUF1249 family)